MGYPANIKRLFISQKRYIRLMTFFKFDEHTSPLFENKIREIPKREKHDKLSFVRFIYPKQEKRENHTHNSGTITF